MSQYKLLKLKHRGNIYIYGERERERERAREKVQEIFKEILVEKFQN